MPQGAAAALIFFSITTKKEKNYDKIYEHKQTDDAIQPDADAVPGTVGCRFR
jgi:hypothetical protein